MEKSFFHLKRHVDFAIKHSTRAIRLKHLLSAHNHHVWSRHGNDKFMLDRHYSYKLDKLRCGSTDRQQWQSSETSIQIFALTKRNSSAREGFVYPAIDSIIYRRNEGENTIPLAKSWSRTQNQLKHDGVNDLFAKQLRISLLFFFLLANIKPHVVTSLQTHWSSNTALFIVKPKLLVL